METRAAILKIGQKCKISPTSKIWEAVTVTPDKVILRMTTIQKGLPATWTKSIMSTRQVWIIENQEHAKEEDTSNQKDKIQKIKAKYGIV